MKSINGCIIMHYYVASEDYDKIETRMYVLDIKILNRFLEYFRLIHLILLYID